MPAALFLEKGRRFCYDRKKRFSSCSGENAVPGLLKSAFFNFFMED